MLAAKSESRSKSLRGLLLGTCCGVTLLVWPQLGAAQTWTLPQPVPVRGVFLQLTDIEDDDELPVPEPSADGEGGGVKANLRDFDPDLVKKGEVAFEASCLDCHDAERALDKRKTYDDWMKTVREMSELDDADIDEDDFKPIATYLASLGPPRPEDEDRATDGSDKDDEEAADSEPEDDEPDKEEEEPDANDEPAAKRPRFDPQEVARGQTAFQSSCTKCHDADRSLSKRKSLSGWLATVRRMAKMDDADVNSSDIRPIAVYLASVSAPASTDADGGADAGDDMSDAGSEFDAAMDDLADFGSGLNISGTLSTLWRGGNDNLENPNFFADVWVRMDWQPSGPLRARVTACTSCHSDHSNGAGFTLELVEATAHFDLMHHRRDDSLPEHCQPKVEAEVKAGRFVVPFGAFSSMSHPGSYRTVTNPLIYNMGRQVNADNGRPPVLPMPYSDEGGNLHVMVPLWRDWRINMDTYVVNGLQGFGAGVNFTQSRSYDDNNHDLGYGGRATIGNKQVKLGGSVMAGRMEDEGFGPLNYHLAGADATARILDDDVRLYFEYGMRRNDSLFGPRQISYGIVAELEVLLLADPNISMLARYDTLEHRDFIGETSIERFTWGVSTTTIGGSLLIFNHEHWNFPTDASPDVDVLGVRWVSTF